LVSRGFDVATAERNYTKRQKTRQAASKIRA
jgi:hypothetical protein